MTIVAPSGPPATPSVNWRATPLAALEMEQIPTELHFVRDHFPPPRPDRAGWSLELTGRSSLSLGLDAVRALPARTLTVVLECAGHRRAEFEPVPPGLPWAAGAVSEAHWTGASLAAALELAGVPQGVQEVVLEGADGGTVENWSGTHRFARSLPIAKALDPDVLLAYEMNGQPIPLTHGGPLRVIVPGWYATDSVKWLARIWFAEEEFEGVFQAHDYRFLAPGETGPGHRMDELPIHALITTPADGETDVRAGELSIRGTAWGGRGGVADVLVSIDGGPWTPVELAPARGPYARVGWKTRRSVAPGTHVIACRAVDRAGTAQPDLPPPNALGYANNAVHHVSFLAR